MFYYVSFRGDDCHLWLPSVSDTVCGGVRGDRLDPGDYQWIDSPSRGSSVCPECRELVRQLKGAIRQVHSKRRARRRKRKAPLKIDKRYVVPHGEPVRVIVPRRRYKDYMESDYWRDRRKWLAPFLGSICMDCGSDEQLTHHHRNYKCLGAEQPDDIELLCWPCHQKRHPGKRQDAKR